MVAPSPIFRLRAALVAIVALAVALVALGLGSGPADGAVKAFHPPRLAAHTLSFKPHGLNPLRVRRATLRIHKHGHTVKHKVSAKKVRHAISKGKEIRLSVPGGNPGNGSDNSGGGGGGGQPGPDGHP